MASKPDDFNWKGIPAIRLRELLAELSDDTLIVPNQMGNIILLNPEWEYIGRIDVRTEEMHLDDVA